jgi:rubrerythrin
MMAKEVGVDEAHDFFEESARDEARHARALEGLLKRYFGQ